MCFSLPPALKDVKVFHGKQEPVSMVQYLSHPVRKSMSVRHMQSVFPTCFLQKYRVPVDSFFVVFSYFFFVMEGRARVGLVPVSVCVFSGGHVSVSQPKSRD